MNICDVFSSYEHVCMAPHPYNLPMNRGFPSNTCKLKKERKKKWNNTQNMENNCVFSEIATRYLWRKNSNSCERFQKKKIRNWFVFNLFSSPKYPHTNVPLTYWIRCLCQRCWNSGSEMLFQNEKQKFVLNKLEHLRKQFIYLFLIFFRNVNM